MFVVLSYGDTEKERARNAHGVLVRGASDVDEAIKQARQSPDVQVAFADVLKDYGSEALCARVEA